MYDEIERAVTGSPKRGLSVLGWIGVAFVGFSMLGVAGAVVGFLAVRSQVREVVEVVERDGTRLMELGVSDAVAGAVAGALAGVEPELLSAEPEAGVRLLRTLQSGDLGAADLEDIVEGSLRIRTEEGDVTAELQGGEEGGQLLVQTPDGDLRLEMERSERGGALTLQADGERLRFGAGEAAAGAPDWVPSAPTMPANPRQVMSASSEQGTFGVVTWESTESPEELVDTYRNGLAGEGYTLRAEHSSRGRRGRSASVVGRADADGRMVFMVASREDGTTRVVLGYGEGMER